MPLKKSYLFGSVYPLIFLVIFQEQQITFVLQQIVEHSVEGEKLG